MSQRVINIVPEKYDQKCAGISIKSVVALRSTVNATTESANETVISKGRFHDLSPSDPAKIIGRIGSTQGARIVRIPARNVRTRSVIVWKIRKSKWENIFSVLLLLYSVLKET